MANTVKVIYGEVDEGADVYFKRVLTDPNGNMIAPGDVSAIDLNVYAQSSDPVYTAPALTFTPGANMYASPQTTGWTEGGLGYNFAAVVSASEVSMDGGLSYRYEWKFTLNAGGLFFAKYVVACKGLVSQ